MKVNSGFRGHPFLLILKLLRDADKVDIWRVISEYCQNSAAHRNQAVEPDLPDGDTIAGPEGQALMCDNLVIMDDLRTLKDFKLLQIGWIYERLFWTVKHQIPFY